MLESEAETRHLGRLLSSQLTPGTVIWLEGDLGSGKTTLVRAILQSAGETGSVKSPTYTLVEVHPVSGLNFYHFDFYRFNNPEEYLDAGLDEYFDGKGVCLVEWPARAEPYLPAPDLVIRLAVDGVGRVGDVQARSPRGERCLTNFVPPAVRPSSSPPPA